MLGGVLYYLFVPTYYFHNQSIRFGALGGGGGEGAGDIALPPQGAGGDDMVGSRAVAATSLARLATARSAVRFWLCRSPRTPKPSREVCLAV